MFKNLIILIFVLCFSCSEFLFSTYSVKYVDGVKERDRFVKLLQENKQKYRVIDHSDNCYEIQYKD